MEQPAHYRESKTGPPGRRTSAAALPRRCRTRHRLLVRWNPERGQALAAQIAARPSLQQAATVPLILAFYCILGGQPASCRDSGTSCTGRSSIACLTAPGAPAAAPRRTWTPAGRRFGPGPGRGRRATRSPTSGSGRMTSPHSQLQLSHAGQDAVDHVAAPRGGPDFDTDKTTRRFVHRSIREHLVAEYVADLPTEKAVAGPAAAPVVRPRLGIRRSRGNRHA